MKKPAVGFDRENRDSRLNRRNVLKAAGAGVVGIGAITGTASASHEVSERAFFGCSQVCVDAKGAEAVIATNGECVKRPIDRRSNRGNLDWEFIYCRSVDDGEAIVGVWYDGTFYPNPNRCAENYDCPNYQ